MLLFNPRSWTHHCSLWHIGEENNVVQLVYHHEDVDVWSKHRLHSSALAFPFSRLTHDRSETHCDDAVRGLCELYKFHINEDKLPITG